MDKFLHWGLFAHEYSQAHLPIREQTTAEGHSVRALYFFSGVADLAQELGDETLFRACETLWNNTADRRMYITGGVGSQSYGEGFTVDYDLPSDRAYTETCAAIALIFLGQRMLALDPDRKYADVMERALYNGVISGMSLEGDRFFYVNPLEVHPEVCRKRHDHDHVNNPGRAGLPAPAARLTWPACSPPSIIIFIPRMTQLYVLLGK